MISTHGHTIQTYSTNNIAIHANNRQNKGQQIGKQQSREHSGAIINKNIYIHIAIITNIIKHIQQQGATIQNDTEYPKNTLHNMKHKTMRSTNNTIQIVRIINGKSIIR